MLNVLLVEDDLDLADTVVQYLEIEGICCVHGANGMAGLQLAKEGGYQVLLLDLNPVSYTHLTLPTNTNACRSRWWRYD